MDMPLPKSFYTYTKDQLHIKLSDKYFMKE